MVLPARETFDLQHFPADHVQSTRLDVYDPPVVDRHERRALRSGFTGVTSLQVAGKDDPGRPRHDFALVHVAERPVVVATIDERLHAARRVRLVPRAPRQRRVEQPDVQRAGDRPRIARHQILAHVCGRIALSMDAQPELFEGERLRPADAQLLHVLRERETLADSTGRVVVATDPHHRRPRLPEPRQLRHEEQPGRVVLPVAVEQVASEQQELAPPLPGTASRAPERRAASHLGSVRPAHRDSARDRAAGCRCAGRRRAGT